MLGEVLGNDRRRDAAFGKFAVDVEPRRDHRGLDRVEHVEAVRQLLEAVPTSAGFQHPRLAVLDAFFGQIVRPPHFEPPVAAPLFVDLAHGAAKIQRLSDRLFNQRFPGRLLHHRRRHVAGGDDGVLRRGRGVHQIGFVEHVAVQFALFGVLHQNLRGLRQPRQQFVRGLRGKNHRFLAARTVGADSVVVAVEIVKGRVRQPGLVEMQRVDLAVEFVLDVLDVVEDPVVGRLSDGQHARLGTLVGGEGIGRDLLLDVFPGKLGFRDRPDDAVVVTRRHQKHRYRARHDDRMQYRFVAISVDHHDIPRRNGRMPDNLVRCRRTVGHEVQVIAVEDTRRVALGGGHRPGVVE